MGNTVYGNPSLRISNRGEIVTDRFGLETASVDWELAYADPDNKGAVLETSIPKVGDAHPDAPWLAGVRRRLKLGAGLCAISMDYEGVNEDTEPVCELQTGLTEEPVETHPAFAVIAGKPSYPRNGALFVDSTGGITTDDATGTFSGFSPYIDFTGTGRYGFPNAYGGIKSFLDFSKAIWSATYYTRTKPVDGVAALGTINDPIGEPPDFGHAQVQFVEGGEIITVQTRNWLYMGFDLQKRGACYMVKHQWMLSGIGGWKAGIYSWTTDNVIDESE